MPPFDEVRAWMFEAALPFWGSVGVDRARGGFFEELDLSGKPTDVAFKRTRVTCRQVYVFSHAALMGWEEGKALSAHGYEFLLKSWMGPDKGWARRLTPTGEVLDPTPDLYDLAFTLFALSWRYRVSNDADVLQHMHSTVDFIERNRAPNGIGFQHELPPKGRRGQNPNMHLLEASIAAYDATGEQRFRDLATEVVGLFKTHFFDGKTLAEYFTDDYKRDPQVGDITEPGHQLEWAWILGQYQRITHVDLGAEARALVSFAERFGVNPDTQFTYNEVRADGAAIDRASRTWPNTERIKGHLALYELGGHDPVPAVTNATRVLLDNYLNVAPRGAWIDVFDADRKPLSKAVPTSTLYHVFLAFAELLRLEPKLRG